MKCPIDGTELVMTERQGVEIDYCPQCRGVWLDRGELDKIIDRAAALENAAPPRPTPQNPYSNPEPPPQRSAQGVDLGAIVGEVLKHKARGGSHSHDQYGHKKKKKGLLGELFDF